MGRAAAAARRAGDARRQAPVRQPAVLDHRRSLRPHHRAPVVRPGSALEKPAGRDGAGHVADDARWISQAAPVISRMRLHARGARVVGLDITPRMIELARAKLPKRRATNRSRPAFLVGDMMALPFPDESFDLVTTGYGIRNVPVIGRGARRDPARAPSRRRPPVARLRSSVERAHAMRSICPI